MSVTQALSSPVDGQTLALIEGIVAGDGAAWQAMQTQIEPLLERWARIHPSMRRRRLAGSVDDVREVVTSTLERLKAHEFANLTRFLESQASGHGSDFAGWLYGAVDYAVREHLRARFGRTAPRVEAFAEKPESPLPSKRDLNTLAARLDDEAPLLARSGVTWEVTLREVLSYVNEQFAPLEARAMQLYLQQGGDSYDELAAALQLASAQDAERLIRKLKERLRVRFRRSETT